MLNFKWRHFSLSLFVLLLSLFPSTSFLMASAVSPAQPVNPNKSSFTSTLHHDNGIIAWRGIKSSNREFRYDNDQIAWRGYLKHQTSDYGNCTVYHPNSKIAWRGATKQQVSDYDFCTVYHSNSKRAWYGKFRAESSDYDFCSLFHSNGKRLWYGAKKSECSDIDFCTFYHENGARAWRGYFAKEKSDSYFTGLYHDNGKMAWSGKDGDPLYDETGKIISQSVAAVIMDVGSDSWVYLSSEGIWELHLCIGEGNYLIFSNQNTNPMLCLSLGSGYTLCFFPHSGDTPVLMMGAQAVDIDY